MSPAKKLGLSAVLIVLVAIVVTVFTVKQPTQTTNQAFELTNLNSGGDITVTLNNDGTMGPASWYGNFSNSLSANQTGTLTFSITDPVYGGPVSGVPPVYYGKPTNVPPTRPNYPTTLPAGASGQGSNGKPSQVPTHSSRGPQTVTSLVLTVSKVEVHLAYLGGPGAQTPSQVGGGAPQTTPQPVDHWETLNITSPVSVDLVKLAKGGGVAALGLTKLAAGRYTEVRLYVQSATATLSDGTNVQLTILGHNNIVRVIQSFTVTVGQNTNLTMDFNAQRSVVYNGTDYLLLPVVARLVESR